MAAENAPHSEPQPLERAVLLDGFNGILRAGRRETAGRRRERGDISLVKTYGGDEQRREEMEQLSHGVILLPSEQFLQFAKPQPLAQPFLPLKPLALPRLSKRPLAFP